MEVIKKPNGGGLSLLNDLPDSSIEVIEKFTAKLNQKPGHTEKSQGFDSVPISAVETSLDEDFAGLWQTENFRWQVVANEIVGSIDLLVFHPVAKTWLKRSGTASVMIMQKSGSEITDMSAKIKNTLVKDFPKLEIMCIKSAAKKLGKKYGRDLNRKYEDEYQKIYSDEMYSDEALEVIEESMSKCATTTELGAIYAEHPDLHENSQFKKKFSYFKLKLLKTK